MNETTSTSTIVTAVLCGHRADGSPIPRRRFEVTREPEPFDFDPDDPRYATWDGRRRVRLWGECRTSARHGLNHTAPLGVVYADTVEAVAR